MDFTYNYDLIISLHYVHNRQHVISDIQGLEKKPDDYVVW